MLMFIRMTNVFSKSTITSIKIYAYNKLYRDETLILIYYFLISKCNLVPLFININIIENFFCGILYIDDFSH